MAKRQYTKRPEDCACYVDGDKECRCCGASLVMPVHSLSRGLVTTLMQCAYEARKKGGYLVDVANVDLTHNQLANLQKLRYFGLMVKHVENGVHIPRHWVITTRGWEFLAREKLVFKQMRSFRNTIVHWTEEEAEDIPMVSIDQIMATKEEPYWQQYNDFATWREYASEQMGLL